MKAPEWFLKELKAFDPDLRCRWSPRLQLWQLERKVRRGLAPGTIKDDGWHDDLIRAREGYLLVASLPPRGFGRHVFEKLKASDLWVDGWRRIADQLDLADEIKEEKAWETFSRDIRDMSKDVFEFLKLRRGATVFNVGFPE